MAQEGAEISWDPKFDGPPSVWSEILPLCLLALALYCHWRFAKWFVVHRRTNPKLKALRYWWPTAMAVPFGILLISISTWHGSSRWIEPICATALLLNLPALPVVCIVAGLGHRPDWMTAILALGAGWLTWHGIIRSLEWYALPERPL